MTINPRLNPGNYSPAGFYSGFPVPRYNPGNPSQLIGVADEDAAALGNAVKRIEVDGTRVVESVEAFGSRAGSTFRGRPPLPDSDVDLYVTINSSIANSPAKLNEVRQAIDEVADLFSAAKGIQVNPVVEIDAIAPLHKLQFEKTPFVPIGE